MVFGTICKEIYIKKMNYGIQKYEVFPKQQNKNRYTNKQKRDYSLKNKSLSC